MLKAKISISSTYFSAVETMIDFFNRIGRLLSVAKQLAGAINVIHEQ